MITNYFNDASNEDFGLVLLEGGPDMTGLSGQRERQAWPGHAGVLLNQHRSIDSRRLRFAYGARVTSVGQRLALLDQLSDALCTGLVELRDAHAPDRVMRGVCSVFTAEVSAPPHYVNIEPRIVVEFECPNATKYDVEPQSRLLSTTPVDIACGTASHGGQIKIAGALSAEIRLKYRGISGALLGELVITPSVLASETLVIDLTTAMVYRVSSSGVYAQAYDMKTGGAWFELFPRDGNREQDVWGSLELSGATGTYYWRRNWVN